MIKDEMFDPKLRQIIRGHVRKIVIEKRSLDNLKEFEKRINEAFSKGKTAVVFENLTSLESEKVEHYLFRQGYTVRQMKPKEEEGGLNYSVRVTND